MLALNHKLLDIKDFPRFRFPWEGYLKDTFTNPSLSFSSLRYYWLRTGSLVGVLLLYVIDKSVFLRNVPRAGVTVIIYQIGSFPDLGLVLLWNITTECPDQCPCTPRGGYSEFCLLQGLGPSPDFKQTKKKKKINK